MEYAQIAVLAKALNQNISRVIVGKEKETELVLTALLSGGHVLLEDVPGTGKTTTLLKMLGYFCWNFPFVVNIIKKT